MKQPNHAAWLEALGLSCDVDGQLPRNTSGGQLSAGRMHGYWVLHEAVLQLRGAAGGRQISGAEVAAVAAGGGPIAGCLLLTG